ncbi:MAG: FHA domain-containing protein [Actinobacteria bacterium]|nr:FHA domain-containing protein [Actinomycetota bacterium]
MTDPSPGDGGTEHHTTQDGPGAVPPRPPARPFLNAPGGAFDPARGRSSSGPGFPDGAAGTAADGAQSIVPVVSVTRGSRSPAPPTTPAPTPYPVGSRPSAPPGVHATSAPAAARTGDGSTGAAVLSLLGRSSTVSGALAGALAGLLGCLVQGTFVPPPEDTSGGSSAGTLAILLTTLTAGLLAAWPHITARAWAKAGIRLLIGAGVGAVAGAVALVAANGYFAARVGDYEYVPLGVTIVIWVAIATAAGVGAGLLRSWRGVLSGLGGGVVGGALGGLMFWNLQEPYAGADYGLIIDGTESNTLLTVIVAATTIGMCIGAAERVARRASLTIIEGNARRTINLDRRSTTIGSSTTCPIVIRDPSVAPQHLTISIDDAVVTVTAHAPVFHLNGDEITSPTFPVRPGDFLRVGGTTIRFDGTAPDGPGPAG